MQRRNFLKSSALVAGLAMTTIPTMSLAKNPNVISKKAAHKAIVGKGKVKTSDKLQFSAPEIAENGKVVPIKIKFTGADSSKVKSAHILSDNDNSRVIDVFFTNHNKEVFVATRMKMAKTQNLIALVVMKDGTVYESKKETKLTIGGCG